MLNSVDLAATLSQTLDSSKWHPLAASAALSRIHQVAQSHWIAAASVAVGAIELASAAPSNPGSSAAHLLHKDNHPVEPA